LIFYCQYVLKIKPTIIYEYPDDLYELLDINGNVVGGNKMSCTVVTMYDYKKTDGYFVSDNLVVLDSYKTEHSPEMVNFGYLVQYKNTTIYYGGDSNKIRKDILRLIGCVEDMQAYLDTCIADYPGNVHTNINILLEISPRERHKVYCMHLDNAREIKKIAKKQGFNVVKLEKLNIIGGIKKWLRLVF
jgi:rhodanese-related sulfurtransferase